jgi:hypothetical protein
MGWFGNSQGERIAELERIVSALTARVVKAESTAADCAERAYRYMKKAEARARRELDEPGAPPEAQEMLPLEGATPSGSRRGAWGARARMALRGHRNGATED